MKKSFIALVLAASFSVGAHAANNVYEVTFVNENTKTIQVVDDEVDLGIVNSVELTNGKPVADIRFSVFGENIVGFGYLDRDWTKDAGKASDIHTFDIYTKVAVGETVQIVTKENEDVAKIKRIR